MVFASILFGAMASASAQPAAPTTDETLTLERALELAMQQQPALREARASADIASARIDSARVARRPTVSVAASVGTGSTRPAPCADDATRTCGGFFDATGSTGLSAQLSWRLFDFGQTSANIRAAELASRATASGIDTSTLDVRTAVEQAYLEAVARGRLIAVAAATVKSEETHLDQARKFVAAQAKDPIEVAQAQARAANARSALAQAQSDEATALANLRASIGWVDPTRAPRVGTAWPTPPEALPGPLSTLVGTARQRRPELAQAELQISAAEASLTATARGNRPVLAASAQTAWDPGTSDWSPEPTWSAGLTLSWQIFDGGRTRAESKIARAQVTSAQASRDALLVQLTSQLDAARAQIVANRANVAASSEAVTAARAQLQLADARYAQGLGSQIELADAQTAVTTAEGNLVQAEWRLADAWAQLRRGLGER
jgi:outer membrane protein